MNFLDLLALAVLLIIATACIFVVRWFWADVYEVGRAYGELREENDRLKIELAELRQELNELRNESQSNNKQ